MGFIRSVYLVFISLNGLIFGSVAFSAPTLPAETSVRAKQQAAEEKARSVHNNVAFNALFLNVEERPVPIPHPPQAADSPSLSAGLPADFPSGCLLRMGPNGAPPEEGFFDGDGIIHCITFPNDRSEGTYSSTYVDTQGRRLERERGGRFVGTLGAVPQGLPVLGSIIKNIFRFQTPQGQKDTCNTAIAEHGGRILALMEQCPPSEIEVSKDGRIKTIESYCRLDGAIESTPITGGALSAHGRTCPWTGERVHVSYQSSSAPYARVDTFDGSFNLKQSVGVDVDCPTMIHDCAMSKNYVVVLDFPLTIRTSRFIQNVFPVEYEPAYGARIGLLPRNAKTDETIWFDCKPGVILHTVNAFEVDDDTVILQALRSEPSENKGYLSEYAPSYLYEYRLTLSTGDVAERCLNAEDIIEFPVINDAYSGQSAPFVYSASVKSIGGPLEVLHQPSTGILLDGVVKHTLTGDNQGEVADRYVLDDRWYGVTEPTVVPKAEGDGEYIMIIATHVPGGMSTESMSAGDFKSHIIVLDGDRLSDGPVWARQLPHHVNYGLHSKFLPWSKMK